MEGNKKFINNLINIIFAPLVFNFFPVTKLISLGSRPKSGRLIPMSFFFSI